MAFVKQNEVVDKTVVSADGNAVGTVKEVAFSLDGKLGFVVKSGDGGERTIPFDQVQGVGEYIVLQPTDGHKPPALNAPTHAAGAASPPAATVQTPPVGNGGAAGGCPHCGRARKPGARFCGGCGKSMEA